MRIPATRVLILAFCAAACGPRDAGSGAERAERAERADSAIAGADSAVVVRELTLGDRGCYLQVEAGGVRREEIGAMELCERADLVGRTVRLGRAPGAVPAMSCQGDPECAQSDTVMLVHRVDVVP
ncbi:hypothetical protein [Longimicrobium sp.]|jgi:hypothetical protein|uniref:hypothetical protein n=1 Tax=Longimicrobium sp. TaxID=2029185 RepID=UPI002F91C5EE